MRVFKTALLASALALGPGCVHAAGDPAPAPASAPTADFYGALLARLQSLDVDRRAAVAEAFGATFVLRSQSAFIRYWTADMPASASSPHLTLDYREGIEGTGQGGAFLVIDFAEPVYPFASVQRLYPALRLSRAPGHLADDGWLFEIPGGVNEIGIGVDARLQFLTSVSVGARLPTPRP
jgi:hypothetical protein